MKNRNEKRFTLIELPVVSRVKAQAFTLIELLVVIGIIALLAAMLFPAIGSVRKHAKKVKAQAAITSLKTAITQYEAQYGLLPLPNVNGSAWSNTPPGVRYGATDIDETNQLTDDQYDALINLLSCVDINDDGDDNLNDTKSNSRKTIFLTGLSATVDSTYNAAEKQQQRTLTDPYRIDGKKYGSRLVVLMDLDGDNQVQVNGAPKYNGKIFIYSKGPDHDDDKGEKTGTDNDDVPSWE